MPASVVPLLDLQRLAGNQAVLRLVARRGSAIQRTDDPEAPQREPVDPRGRADQLEMAIKFTPFPRLHFKIDLDATVKALEGLTPAEGKAVKAEYERRTKWNLGWLIAGVIEMNDMTIENSLSKPERTRLLNMLSGTVAANAGQQNAIDDSRWRSLAAELKSLIDSEKTEQVCTLLRQHMAERGAIDDQYFRLFKTRIFDAVSERLSGRDRERALALWKGDTTTADKLALEGDVDKRDKAEKQLAKYGEAMKMIGQGGELEAKRRDTRAAVEARVESLRAEKATTGKPSHLQEVLGDDLHGKLASDVGVGTDQVVTAIAQGEAPEQIATRLARADREDTLKAADIESAMIELRHLAIEEATRLIAPGAKPSDGEAFADAIIAGWYARMRARFLANALRPLESAISEHGSRTEGDRNRALLAARGDLPDWQQLYFAVRAKDMDRVRHILGGRTRTQVKALAQDYHDNTPGHRDLEKDLLGDEGLQKAIALVGSGEAKEAAAEKSELLQGGVFESKSEDEAARLAEEGQWQFAHIATLERRVMENRGLFAEVRDWMGNLEHRLVERARDDAAMAKAALDNALLSNPPELDKARTQIQELRHVAARLKRNVEAYKTATKEAFEEFVDMAVLAVTTVVTLGEGTAFIMALRTTAATIATKLVLKGDEYSPSEFLMDLRAGIGGALGGKLAAEAEGLINPVAKKLAVYAEKKGFSTKLVAGVAGVTKFETSHIITNATTNAVTGQDLSAGMGLTSQAQGAAQGQLTHMVKKARAAKRAAAAIRDMRKGGPTEEPVKAAQPQEPAAPAEPTQADSGGPTRAPEGPTEPRKHGIPHDSAKYLQLVSDQLNVVLKVRPVNPAADVLNPNVLPKMELIKAKSINAIDLAIGAPLKGEGLVGLFKPRKPSTSLPKEMYTEAMDRYRMRKTEYENLMPYYEKYVKQGLVRIEGGLLKVADPRSQGGKNDAHGKFKAVTGDIDVYDITHADGTALTDDQRTTVENLLRSAGIGVEHGAHEWWPTQHPEAFDPKIYQAIKNEHTSKTQLVAFAPKKGTHGVWADTAVTGGPRREGVGDRHLPLKGAAEHVPHGGGPAGPGGPGHGGGGASGAGGGGSYMPTGEDLRHMVYDAANELMGHPDVQQVAGNLHTHPEWMGQRLAPQEGIGLLGMAAYFRETQGVVPGGPHNGRRWQGYVVGESGASEGQRVGSLDARVNGEGRYADIAERINGMLERMPHQGDPNQRLAIALQQFMRGEGRPTWIGRGRRGDMFANLSVLFMRETVRNPATAAFMSMTLDRIARGETTFEAAFAAHAPSDQQGGEFPMSMLGAQDAAADLNHERAGGYGPRTRDADIMAARETELARDWVESEMRAARIEGFQDEAQARAFIQQALRHGLHESYGMHPQNANH